MHIHHARSPVEICLETHTYRNIYTPWTPFTPINPTAGPDDPFPTRRQKRPHKQINRLEGDLLRRTCNNQHMKPTRRPGDSTRSMRAHARVAPDHKVSSRMYNHVNVGRGIPGDKSPRSLKKRNRVNELLRLSRHPSSARARPPTNKKSRKHARLTFRAFAKV